MATTLYMSALTQVVQYFQNLGLIAAGGIVQTYVGGSVNTPVTTYTDSTGTVPNANPLTLNSAGRPAGASGAQVAFWAPSGTAIKAVVTDAAGNSLFQLDNIPCINDPAASGSLQSLLASATTANAAGAGPVGGVDFVANAVKSYDVFADMRAANAPILVAGQTLNVIVEGALAINDGLGGDFYWSAASTANDNGTTVIKPNSLTNALPGRWLRMYSAPYGAQGTIASAATTDLGTLGTNVVQISGTTGITSLGAAASVARPLYFLTFSGNLTLTNSATLVLPGGANINTAAGDSAIALYQGGGSWTVLNYTHVVQSQTVIVKPTDQAIASSTVLTNDTALLAALPVAGSATYLIQARLQLLGSGGTAQGWKVQLTFNGTPVAAAAGGGVASGNLTAAPILAAINAVNVNTAISNTTPDFYNVDVILQVSAIGTLVVQFAQNSSSVNPTKMLAGSTLTITRLG